LKVLLVAGARPNFMKVAPIAHALKARGIDSVLVHTGQHYDPQMSDTFFKQLCLSKPDFSLDVGSATHAVQTARVMERFEPVLLETRPDWVVVVGDVNSTLGVALVVSKRREELACGLAHVEAGLRSRDWRMPEEVNRVVTDQLSDLLLTPSRDARENLIREGAPDELICFVGNVMIDTVFAQRDAARAVGMSERLRLGDDYVVATLHRPSNVDDPATLSILLQSLTQVAEERPVVLPLHPRTRARVREFGLESLLDRVKVSEPLGYLEMLGLTDGASIVLTDSGGVQEETTALGVPCVTLREATERPVTITHGTNRLAPWPLTVEGVVGACRDAYARRRERSEPPEGWDGCAANRVVSALVETKPGARVRVNRPGSS
jgi:UDP-N-acetylglucosamine 2-epimerase (non-hydrolysing)